MAKTKLALSARQTLRRRGFKAAVEHQQKRQRAYELFMGGHSFPAIGKQLGISHDTAQRWAFELLDRVISNVDLNKELKTALARYDRLYALHEPKAADPVHARICLEIMRDRQRILGLLRDGAQVVDEAAFKDFNLKVTFQPAPVIAEAIDVTPPKALPPYGVRADETNLHDLYRSPSARAADAEKQANAQEAPPPPPPPVVAPAYVEPDYAFGPPNRQKRDMYLGGAEDRGNCDYVPPRRKERVIG